MRGIGVVALVFAGVMMMWQAIALTSIPISYATLASDLGELQTGVYVFQILPAVTAFALGLTLILGRHSLARRLFDDSEISVAIAPAEGLRIGLTLIGTWLVANAIPGFFVSLAQGALQTSVVLDAWEGYSVPPADIFGAYVNIVMPAVSIVIGVLLVVKAKSIAVRLWSGPKSREAGSSDI